MKKPLTFIRNHRLQVVLVLSFSLVAALTVGISTYAVARVINQYLQDAESSVVARDMNLARAFYDRELTDVASISRLLASEKQICSSLEGALRSNPEDLINLNTHLVATLDSINLPGLSFVGVFALDGSLVSGRVYQNGVLAMPVPAANWQSLPIIQTVLATGFPRYGTEIIPGDLLAQVGLAEQLQIEIVETPLASPTLFDPRASTAALSLASGHPIFNECEEMVAISLVVTFMNNEFTLVDKIREVAGIDTVTIFLGDMRVSTNVMNRDGGRAVGTRISKEVYDVVLTQGKDYVGRAYVVDEWFITRYQPLLDHLGQVVGVLYVGASESEFNALVNLYNRQVLLIGGLCVLIAAVVAFPLTRLVIKPLAELLEATRRLGAGDMTVRVSPKGSGEIAELGKSFDTMVDALDRTQHELLQKETLASIGQLAAGVAHEINNPLGTILLFSQALHKEIPSENTTHRRDLEMIINETLRCKTIVADLLNFARQQKMLSQETDIHALIDQTLNLVARQPVFDAIRLVRDFAPSPLIIQADPAQLQQVFTNLINNAADAMSEGGTITILTWMEAPSYAVIEITDTGVGIPEENLSKLYTPFFTTKSLGKGTGLGLAIVYGIIKMHRGQISVRSKLGQGTTFTIRLPLSTAKMLHQQGSNEVQPPNVSGQDLIG